MRLIKDHPTVNVWGKSTYPRGGSPVNTRHAEYVRLICLFAAGFSLLLLFASLTSAQTTQPITSSGLNTQVSAPSTLPSGKVQYDITGGTRPSGGANLFHSFGDFNVPNNNIANFLNESSLATSNILGRVTGGTLSSIFGTIQTTGFGNANLFLMNPAGFLFGPNATVNVGGMVSFTSADYLRLTDNARFNAIPGPADALLTAAPVAAFGFLGSNPGAITVQGSQFTVTEGTGISMIGGEIKFQNGALENGTIQSARLSAPGGQIQLTSLTSVGEVLMPSGELPSGGVSLPTSGSIIISLGSLLDVSGQTGGKISIRSGQLQIDNATLQSNTVLGDSGGIEIASSAMSMKGGSIQTSTAGPGSAGDIAVNTGILTMSDGAFIASNLFAGRGGNIRANATESISISGLRPGITFVGPIPFTNLPSGLYTQTFSAARGGNIDVTTPQLYMQGGFLQTQTFGPGRAGDIVTTVGRLEVAEGSRLSSTTFSTGGGGNVTLTATDSIYMSGHFPGIFGVGNSTTTNFPSQIGTTTFAAGRAGDVVVTVGRLDVTEGSRLTSTTFGTGRGGNVTLTATDSIHVIGQHAGTLVTGGVISTNIPSEISTNTNGAGEGGQLDISTPVLELQTGLIGAVSTATGQGGSITMDVGELSVTKGAVINSSSFGNGPGGSVSVNADTILVSGRSGVTYSNSGFVFENTRSGIASATFGPQPSGNVAISASNLVISNEGQIQASTGGAGAAGTISINVENATLTTGGRISSSSGLDIGNGLFIGSGQGGAINLTATDTLSASGQGSGLFTSTVANGNGGAMNVQVARIDLRDGAVLSASSIGSGNAGTVTVQGLASSAQSVLIDGQGSEIVTETKGTGAGGNISVNANTVTFQNGAHISASSTGPGNTGNITITSGNQFTMNNASVTTEATQSGGGAIKITTNPSGTVQLNDSVISASVLDGTGGGGSVDIDPQSVVLINSQILAQAVQGPGGNINITTNLLLPDSTSLISASSQFGQQGNIVIQSPVSPASGKIVPLGQKPLVETALLSQRCAALAGGSISSFTVAGRDSLPAEPGGWLSNPVALSMPESEDGSVREANGSMLDEAPLLSVRKIAPPGFLTQAFAVEFSGCQS
jgi:filamentous hemagglutinin family protein